MERSALREAIEGPNWTASAICGRRDIVEWHNAGTKNLAFLSGTQTIKWTDQFHVEDGLQRTAVSRGAFKVSLTSLDTGEKQPQISEQASPTQVRRARGRRGPPAPLKGTPPVNPPSLHISPSLWAHFLPQAFLGHMPLFPVVLQKWG